MKSVSEILDNYETRHLSIKNILSVHHNNYALYAIRRLIFIQALNVGIT